jgi:branched-chain amino acid transport system permease protein
MLRTFALDFLVKVGLDGNRFRLLIGIGFLVIVFWSSDGVIGLWERWRRSVIRGERSARGGHGHG